MATTPDDLHGTDLTLLLRRRLDDDLQEFRCAQTMLQRQSARGTSLRWNVIWEGRRAIAERLARHLQCMGGLLGQW